MGTGFPPNPYATPSASNISALSGSEIARSKLMPVGITLLVVSLLSFFAMAGYFVLNLVVLLADDGAALQPPPEMNDEGRAGFYIGAYGALSVMVIATLSQLVIAAGSSAFLRGKSRGLAMFTSILTVIPCCTSPFCILGVPIGIWALIVLADPQVKQAMR